ncbi:hypothetical protein ACVWYH_008354 [Bradyrhizobium sp. GM24.11]
MWWWTRRRSAVIERRSRHIVFLQSHPVRTRRIGRAKRNPSPLVNAKHDGFRKCSTHPTALSTRLRVLATQFARALLGLSSLWPPSCPRGRREDRVLTSHPRSAARRCSAGRTAQQHTGGANHSAFPARWVDGLCRALPGAEFLLASLAPRIDDAVDPVGRSTPPRQLDRSNDGQDHKVLPYARSPVATGSCSSVHTRCKNAGETN